MASSCSLISPLSLKSSYADSFIFQKVPFQLKSCFFTSKKAPFSLSVFSLHQPKGISSASGALVFVFLIWWLYRVVKKELDRRKKEKNFKQNVAVVTKKSWDDLILDSDTPVLVEFYASWCGPCRMVHRVIDELATEYRDKLRCFVLKADEDSHIPERYNVNAVPVVLLFKNGKKVDSVVGTMPKEFYSAAIDRVLSS